MISLHHATKRNERRLAAHRVATPRNATQRLSNIALLKHLSRISRQ
jgi:hypothetical protein